MFGFRGQFARKFRFSSSTSNRHRVRLNCESMEPRTLLSAYTPVQVRHAYGLDQVTAYSSPNGQSIQADGSGQTIAIVDAYDDPNLASDIATFDQNFNLSAINLTRVNQTGGSRLPATDPSSDQGKAAFETTLDVEWAHAIAPGARILLVETNSPLVSDMIAGVKAARNVPGVVAVSMSWGIAETYQLSNGTLFGATEAQYDSAFTTPAGHVGGSSGFSGAGNLAGGITFVAAAGDSGAAPAYPSVSPNVVSVGGTTLPLRQSGGYDAQSQGFYTYANSFGDTDPLNAESAWSQGGGGISQYESRPSYQNGVTTDAHRNTPDVAYDADSATGFQVYYTFGVGPNHLTGWLDGYGTSAGAPQWAALIAIADQGRAVSGLGSLDGRSQTLPTLYQMKEVNYHDITSGNNGQPAHAGYDLATGLGTPTGDLVYDLANPGLTPNQRVVGHLYLNLLHRSVDPFGLNAWTGALNGGQSTTWVTQQIEASDEYRTVLINGFYQKYLNRNADPSGLDLYLGSLRSGATDAEVEESILASSEYFNRYGGTDVGFVFGLFVDVLDRTPSQNDWSDWVSQYDQYSSAITGTFFASTEYQTILINSYYEAVLHRPADSGGLNLFLGSLQSGATYEEVLAAIAGSAEYFNRS